MQRQRHYSIKTKLMVIYLLIAVPLIALLAAAFYERYRADQRNVLTERFDIARLTASNFDLFVDQTVRTEIIAGNTIIDQNLNTEDTSRLLTRIVESRRAAKERRSLFSNAVFTNRDGIVLAAAIPNTVGENRSNRPAIKEIIDGKESAVGDLQVNADGEPGFVIATGIKRNNNLVGIVGISVKANQLTDVFDIIIQQGGANIVDSSGHLIYQSQTPSIPLSKRDWSQETFVKTALAGKVYRTTGIVFPLDGSFRTGVEVPIRNIRWAAGSFVPVESVLAPVRQTALVSAFLALLTLIITLTLAYVLGNRIAESLITLKSRMRDAPKTGFTERVFLQTGDEIEDLANSFNQMQDEILAAQTEQRRLQEQLQERNKELAELYEMQKNIASVLQESLLPKIAQRLDHLEIGLKLESATEAALVGGDFFDFFEISDNRFGIVIGDVSGKGIEAATLAAMVRNTIRAFAYDGLSPAEVVKKVNEVSILETPPSIFVTLFYGVFNAENYELTYTNAAHWPPVVYNPAQQTFYTLETGGLPLAIFPKADYTNHAIKLAPGLIIVLYTDGVVESRIDTRFFGQSGLEESIKSHAFLSSDEIAQSIVKDAKSFGGEKLLDDAAAFVIKTA
ncbi:MAG: SpoIIE family protein phosphatase [Firmicutes bacterium]|nr:SpoIIE family protein phosphatase [Bacillota bacterium]